MSSACPRSPSPALAAEIPAGLPGWAVAALIAAVAGIGTEAFAVAPLLIDIVRPQGRDHNLFHIGEEVSTAHSAIQRHGAVISDSPRPPTKVVAFH